MGKEVLVTLWLCESVIVDKLDSRAGKTSAYRRLPPNLSVESDLHSAYGAVSYRLH